MKKIKYLDRKKEKDSDNSEKYQKQVAKINTQIDKQIAKIKKFRDTVKQNTAVISYTTFMSMNGQAKALNAFKIPKARRCCMIFCCSKNKLEHKYFEGRWLEVERAPEPSIINWENLAVGPCNQCVRKLFIALISIILMAASFALILIAKQEEKTARSQIPDINCNNYNVTQSLAYND